MILLGSVELSDNALANLCGELILVEHLQVKKCQNNKKNIKAY